MIVVEGDMTEAEFPNMVGQIISGMSASFLELAERENFDEDASLKVVFDVLLDTAAKVGLAADLTHKAFMDAAQRAWDAALLAEAHGRLS